MEIKTADKYEITYDMISPRRIAGWCIVPNRSDLKAQINLLNKDKNVLASTTANIFRQDLVDANIGDGSGNFGFDISGDFKGCTNIQIVLPVSITIPNMKRYDIHEDDNLFWNFYDFCSGYLDEGSKAIQLYLEDGKKSAELLNSICIDILRIKSDKIKILEFNAGYGCVTRHLDKKLFDITASSLQTKALEFLQKAHGVNTYLSTTVPLEFKPDNKYDIVFALSAFSHFDKKDFGKWIKALYDCTVDDGYLIFTAHGETSNNHMGLQLANGFAFKANEKIVEKNTYSDYGVSVASKKFVENEINYFINTKPLVIKEAFWWGHQDLYIIKKQKKYSQ